MRKVVDSINSNVVLVENANPKKFYGFVNRTYNDQKGFICQDFFEKGLFRPRSTRQLTDGNGWPQCTDKTLVGVIRNMMLFGCDVNEFDTFEEMALWLAQLPKP